MHFSHAKGKAVIDRQFGTKWHFVHKHAGYKLRKIKNKVLVQKVLNTTLQMQVVLLFHLESAGLWWEGLMACDGSEQHMLWNMET